MAPVCDMPGSCSVVERDLMNEQDDILREDVARSLEVSVGLLPILPELLTDLLALGASAEEVCRMLRSCDLPSGARVLDLGCGKGAVSLAIARDFEFDVLGVDAFASFVDEARRLATERGVTANCRFECADLRQYLRPLKAYDVVVYAAVGDVLGPLDETVRGLRDCIRPGGHLVLDDAFLREETSAPSGYESYAGYDETRRRLTSGGFQIVEERVFSVEETRVVNQWNNARISSSGRKAIHAHPEHADAIRAYIRRQEEECELLESVFVPTMWLLRRADSSGVSKGG